MRPIDYWHTTCFCERTIRIADLGVTAAALTGLELCRTTIGADLSSDLA